jgi:YD repeat-containing protein
VRARSNAAGLHTARTEAQCTAGARTTAFEYQSGTNLLTATVDPLSRRTDPLTRTESFTYDGEDNVLISTDRKSQIFGGGGRANNEQRVANRAGRNDVPRRIGPTRRQRTSVAPP